jgi:WD40 repeat protein
LNGRYIGAYTTSGSVELWHVLSAAQDMPPQLITASALTQGLAEPSQSFSSPKIAVTNDASAVALSDNNPQSDNNIILRHADGRTLTLLVSSVIADLSFDWSGKQLAAVICTDKAGDCHTSELRVWDAGTGKLLSRYKLNNMATLAFMPDNTTIIVGGINSIAFVNLSTHAVASRRFLEKAGIVQALAVSDDGSTLGAAIDPNTATGANGPYTQNQVSGHLVLQLWDIATQQPLGTPLPDRGVSTDTSFAFTPSGDIFDSSGGEFLDSYPIGISQLETLACRVANRNLTRSEWLLYAPHDQRTQLCPQAPS